MLPYTEKYRPRTIAELQGHDKAAAQVLEFCKNHKTHKKQAALLHGPPGAGKTSLALAIASEMDLEVIELNASDVRNAKSIKELLGPAMQQQSLFSRGKLILFDEVDGLSGRKDRGGAGELVKLIKESSYPVILTANDAYSKKLSKLRRYCLMVELKSPSWRSVNVVLKKVADAEGIIYDAGVLEAIARRSGGDLRGALTDLQTLSATGMISEADLEVLGGRRQAESMFNAMQRVFKGSDAKLAREAIDSTDEDIDTTVMWIDENIPREYEKPEDTARAYSQLSRADVFKGRIMRWQHWRFLIYVIDFSTAGVALAKKERYKGFTKYQRPTRLLRYWQANRSYAKRDSIAEKIAENTHISKEQALKGSIYDLRAAMLTDKKMQEQLEINDEELGWLKKQS